MLHLPMASLPREALIYAGYLCLRVGMCIETLLSAYTTYAQIVEGLSCDDDLYTVTPTIRAEWDVALRDYELVPLAVEQGPPRLRVQRAFRPAGSPKFGGCIAHNLCCVVKAIFTVGLAPTFWSDAPLTLVQP